jgi:hypothetical protein
MMNKLKTYRPTYWWKLENLHEDVWEDMDNDDLIKEKIIRIIVKSHLEK